MGSLRDAFLFWVGVRIQGTVGESGANEDSGVPLVLVKAEQMHTDLRNFCSSQASVRLGKPLLISYMGSFHVFL